MRSPGGDAALAIKAACPASGETHQAHLDWNGECPWCGGCTEQVARQVAKRTVETRPYGKDPELAAAAIEALVPEIMAGRA